MSPITHCKFVHSMQFLILDLGLGLQLLCNVVCTDVHCSAKVIATLVPSLCFRLVGSLGSGRAGGGAVSTPQQVGGTGSCPTRVTGHRGHQSPQSFWRWASRDTEEVVGY